MISYSVKLGAGEHRVFVKVEAVDANGALAKLQAAFAEVTILNMQVDAADGAKVRFPELRGRRLFKEPKASALFSEPPLLVAD